MKHFKKMIAPIIIATIIIAYYIGIVMIVVPLILSAVMLGVLISRIKEIQGGEEDDISQY